MIQWKRCLACSARRNRDGHYSNARRVFAQNIREYGMYIALFVIMAIFTVTTKGVFISSRNISNLLNQTGYIAVLAVGMTLVIVIRHIDLSVGFLAGFLGAVAAIALVFWNLPVWVVIPLVLALGVVAGLITAFLVAQLGIPSFVASLAGWLIYRGAILLVTAGTGTIIIPDETFNAIGNGFIPDIPDIGILTRCAQNHPAPGAAGDCAVHLSVRSTTAERSRPITLKSCRWICSF